MSDENINICINVVTKKSITEAGNKLDTLGKKGANAGKKIANSTAKAQKQLDSLKQVTFAMTAALATLGFAASKSINAFKKFENGLINVEKVTNISGARLDAFGKEIDNLASRIPVATSELLNIAQTAGQLGIEGARDILAFTEAVALLTRTTDLTIDSAQSLAQLIAVTASAPDDIGKLAAVIVELGNNFSATESQILNVSTRIAQSTTRYNLLAEDALKLGTVIAAVGEKAEASGTAIGKTFRALDDAIAENSDNFQTLSRLTGLQGEELENLFKSNPTELLRKFTQGLGQAEKNGERSALILEDFGLKTDRVNRVLGPLIKNTDKVNKAFRLAGQQVENQTAAIEEARKQFRSLESAELLTANATAELAKTIGQVLEPAYRIILETIRTVAMATTRFVEDNVPLLKLLATTVGIVGIAFVGIAIKAGILSTSLGVLAGAATLAWKALITPVGLAIAGIAAVGIAIAATVIYWEEIKIAIDVVLIAMLEITATTLEFFAQFESSARKALGFVARLFVNYFNTVTAGLQLIAKGLDEAFGTNISENIENFKKKMDDSITSFENSDGSLKKLAKSSRDFAASMEEGIVAQLADREAKENTKLAIRQLQDENEKLTRSIINGTEADVIAAQKKIDNNKKQILSLRGLDEEQKKSNDKKKKGGVDTVDVLTRIEKEFQDDLAKLRKLGDDEAIKNLKKAVIKEKDEKIKAFRDEQIKSNEFSQARRAQLLLDVSENSRIKEEALEKDRQKAEEKEKEKQEKLLGVRNEVRDLEAEEEELKFEIKIEKDEREKEDLRLLLEEKHILLLEAQKKDLEASGNHLGVMRKQREIDAAKEAKSKKLRTDEDIRQSRHKSQVDIILSKTTSEQIIDIGENLMKAGIIQGKTAGKALKTLKTAEAIVNTYGAANHALNSGIPFPFNIIAAAGVVASGLANVATIQSQKFATGGIVQLPQNATSQRGIDTVPALLSVGEEVLTRSNPRHRDNISRDSEPDGMIEELRGLRSDIQNMQTIVEIDGKVVADVIQEQRFRGVS